MIESMITELVHNIALLLALVLVFDLVTQNLRNDQTLFQKVTIGLIIGLIGLMIMLSPWVLMPGVVFDTRSVLLGISGLFFGAVPTLIAMLITATLRVSQGGPGLPMGVAVIVATGTIGILWNRVTRLSGSKMSALQFLIFGLVIHIAMMLCSFLLPEESRLLVQANITLPVLTIYPLGTMLLGLILKARYTRVRQSEKTQESETRYRIVAENTYDWEYWFNTNGEFEYISPSCETISSYKPEEFKEDPSITWKMIHPDDLTIYKKHRESPAEEKKGQQVDFRIIRRDGKVRWIGHNCQPVYDAGGAFMGTRGSNRDITAEKQAREALLVNEEKYRSLTEEISDVVWEVDAETMRFTYVSPAMEKLRGYTVDEMMSLYIYANFPAELRKDREKLIRERRAALLDGTVPADRSYVDEVLQPRKDGSNVWTEIKTQYYQDPETGHVLIRGVTRDISARKQAENALRESEEKYRFLTEEISDVVWILDAETMYFKYVSPSVEKLRGYTVEEVMAEPIDAAVVSEAREALRLSTRQRSEKLLQGLVSEDEVFINEVAQPRKDGSSVMTEVQTRFYINQETGKVEVLGVSRDITARKKAEDALRDSEEKYRLLLENQTDLVVKTDTNGNFVYVNKAYCDLFDKTEEELIGNTYIPLVHPDDLPVVEEAIARLFKPPFTCTYDERAMTRFGWRWISWSSSVVQDESGTIIALVGSGRDITDRKEFEAKILETQGEMEKMLVEADQSRGVLLSILEDQRRTEEALHQEQYLMNSLMDTIPDTIYFKDVAGRFLRVNKAQVERLGVEDQMDLLGKTDFDFFTKEHAKLAHENELTIIKTGKPLINSEELLTYSDRPSEWVLTTKMPLYSRNREIIGTYGLTKDISAIKKAENELQIAYDLTLEGWAAALELREKETALHSRNVVELTLKMAKELAIPDEAMAHIRRGALLHDIGKMGIPDNILLKPGKLTDEEWVVMRMHPVFAFELLSDIPYLQPALDIPYAHHERWDGSGYPLGLKGENIPLIARIFAVVDVWDALLSDRPYRPGWPKEEVIRYLREHAGKQFDPQIVEVFLRVVAEAESQAGK
jgi:PAS domain S-box-containing protein